MTVTEESPLQEMWRAISFVWKYPGGMGAGPHLKSRMGVVATLRVADFCPVPTLRIEKRIRKGAPFERALLCRDSLGGFAILGFYTDVPSGGHSSHLFSSGCVSPFLYSPLRLTKLYHVSRLFRGLLSKRAPANVRAVEAFGPVDFVDHGIGAIPGVL